MLEYGLTCRILTSTLIDFEVKSCPLIDVIGQWEDNFKLQQMHVSVWTPWYKIIKRQLMWALPYNYYCITYYMPIG